MRWKRQLIDMFLLGCLLIVVVPWVEYTFTDWVWWLGLIGIIGVRWVTHKNVIADYKEQQLVGKEIRTK